MNNIYDIMAKFDAEMKEMENEGLRIKRKEDQVKKLLDVIYDIEAHAAEHRIKNKLGDTLALNLRAAKLQP